MTFAVWLYLGITFEMCPFFWNILEFIIYHKHLFFYSSILVCSSINYIILNKELKEIFNKNIDLVVKFFYLLFTNINNFLNFFILEIKMFFVFLKDFKYKDFFLKWFLIFKKIISAKFNLWRPLFKKWSYFGYFRSNRSKWIK